MATDDDVYYVNTDIEGLKAGTTYHYRLVAVNEKGTRRGETGTFTLPATTKPTVETGRASRITPTSAKVDGRVNPLGLPTQFFIEYGSDEKYGSKTALGWSGQQEAPRLVFAELKDLKPGTTYHFRVGAVNATGTSHGADATFRTSPKP
jgi:phosphodiesterase/alkaline phosphatase D-like protein